MHGIADASLSATEGALPPAVSSSSCCPLPNYVTRPNMSSPLSGSRATSQEHGHPEAEADAKASRLWQTGEAAEVVCGQDEGV